MPTLMKQFRGPSRHIDWGSQMIDVSESILRDTLMNIAGDTAVRHAWWHDRAALVARLHRRELEDLAARTRLAINATGVAVVRTGGSTPPDSIRLLHLALGELFGPVVTIAPDEPGRPLFKISAVEGKNQTGAYKGNAKKCAPIGFHTDGSGVAGRIPILGMSCIRPAKYGGESRWVDTREVLPCLTPSTCAVLERPFPRENPYRDALATELSVEPIFDPRNCHAFSYHPARVRNGIRMVRGSLSSMETSALSELDEQLELLAVDLLLQTGDILLLDNRRVAHDRRAFEDDSFSPRLIERLWIGSNSL
jgi:hypothetical protein